MTTPPGPPHTSSPSDPEPAGASYLAGPPDPGLGVGHLLMTRAAGEYDQTTRDTIAVTWDQFADVEHDRRPDKRHTDDRALLLGYHLAWFVFGRCDCGVAPGYRADGSWSAGCPDHQANNPTAEWRGHALGRRVGGVTALGVDLDKGPAGEDLTVGQRDEYLGRLRASGYETVVWSSHSYDPPEKNNLRAVVQLSREVTPAEWSRGFYGAALRHLRIPSGIGDRPDPRRFWYAPSAKSGAPVLHERFRGVPLDVDAVLAAIPTEAEKPKREATPRATGQRGLEDFLAEWGLDARVYPHGDQLRADVECPWADQHTSDTGPTSTTAFESAEGVLGFKCLHGHCAGRGWRDFRAHYDQSYDPDREMPEPVPWLGEWVRRAVTRVNEPARLERAEARAHARKVERDLPRALHALKRGGR